MVCILEFGWYFLGLGFIFTLKVEVSFDGIDLLSAEWFNILSMMLDCCHQPNKKTECLFGKALVDFELLDFLFDQVDLKRI